MLKILIWSIFLSLALSLQNVFFVFKIEPESLNFLLYFKATQLIHGNGCRKEAHCETSVFACLLQLCLP